MTRPPHEHPDEIVSPCVEICELDITAGLCRGCLRTLTEIAQWTQYSAAQRDRIMSELGTRSIDER